MSSIRNQEYSDTDTLAENNTHRKSTKRTTPQFPLNTTMENEDANPNAALITSFCEITSASKPEAAFFLESHNFNLDAAVSTFFDNNSNTNIGAPPAPPAQHDPATRSRSKSPSSSPNYSPSDSPSRSRSASPPPASRAPYELRARRGGGEAGKGRTRAGTAASGGVRTLADLNRMAAEESDSDDEDQRQEYYTGGEKSGMLVQDPSKLNDVEAIFNQARQSGGVERPPVDLNASSSRSRSFTGTARLLSGETVTSVPSPQHPEYANHTITFWRNGFTIDDGPLRRLDDPENSSFLESIKKSECPKELQPADHRTSVHVDLVRRDEDYKEVKKPQKTFQGAGRTLRSSSSTTPASSETVAATSFTAAPMPQEGLIIDESSPSTSIQLRLADGTRMVSRFNHYHTVRDIRAFVDASRPGGSRDYQLQMMGFPPKQLTDLNQTIEQAGLANSVIIQRY